MDVFLIAQQQQHQIFVILIFFIKFEIFTLYKFLRVLE